MISNESIKKIKDFLNENIELDSTSIDMATNELESLIIGNANSSLKKMNHSNKEKLNDKKQSASKKWFDKEAWYIPLKQ